MKAIFAAIACAALAGCGAGGWIEQETGLSPAQQSAFAVTVVRTVSCATSDVFGNVIVQRLDSAACQIAGGSIVSASPSPLK